MIASLLPMQAVPTGSPGPSSGTEGECHSLASMDTHLQAVQQQYNYTGEVQSGNACDCPRQAGGSAGQPPAPHAPKPPIPACHPTGSHLPSASAQRLPVVYLSAAGVLLQGGRRQDRLVNTSHGGSDLCTAATCATHRAPVVCTSNHRLGSSMPHCVASSAAH